MKSTTRWWGAGAIVIAIGLATWLLWSGDDPSDPRVPARLADDPSRVPVEGAASAEVGARRDPTATRLAGADGGLASRGGLVARPAGSPQPLAPALANPAVQRALQLPGSDPAAERESSGWQLGRARRRLEVLDARVTQLEANAARLRSEGQEELAARQEQIVARTRQRAASIREEEATLSAQAQADGTLGDVDRGYEEGVRIRDPNAPMARGSEPRGAVTPRP